MNTFFRTTTLALCSAFVLMAAAVPAHADQATPARTTFDGQIRNNSLALSPDEATAVVSYSERPDVIVYDLATNSVRGVRNGYASSTVTRLDTASGQARAVITGFAQPRQGLRLSPDGAKLYVTNFLGDKLSIVDTQTDKIEAEIAGFNKIRAISVTADGKTLFAANSGSNDIAVVDIGARRITSMVAVGRDPYGAALAPDGRQIYAGNLADNSVSVIDVATPKVVATITGFKQPRQAIVFTRDGRFAYVLNEDLSLAKVERGAQRIVGGIAPAPASTKN